MLHNASELHDLELQTRDGALGKVKDFYFDDHYWTIRYLVVETGSWLHSRRVLIASSVLFAIDWTDSQILVDLTRDQVRQSPGIDTAEPVSRALETDLHTHYGWNAYWLGAGFDSPTLGAGPALATAGLMPVTDLPPRRRLAPDGDPDLRSAHAVRGYYLEAADGSIGHVDDYVFDDASWLVRYVVVDTRNWLPGRKVLLAPEWISEVKWSESRVYVDIPRAEIKNAPVYDPGLPIETDYLERLHAHHDRFATH
ncbi:MAG: PRC-barrel domain containing protein [Burkholderiales bacterium]|nr:PRC-barrel domain containing protein [Opitutaceae bacterium]